MDDIEVTSYDNIWSVINFKTDNNDKSSVILYDNQGNILNVYVFGKQDNSQNYVLYTLEVIMMKHITDQNIVFMGNLAHKISFCFEILVNNALFEVNFCR